MSWERGRTDVQRLITDGELDRVAPSTGSRRPTPRRRLCPHQAGVEGHRGRPRWRPPAQLRRRPKACAALLVVQGLRATTRGGHIAVMDAVRSLFNDRGGMEVFGLLHTLRRRRNRTEYPDPDSPGVDEARLGSRWTRHAPSWTPPSESSTAEHWTCSGEPRPETGPFQCLRACGGRRHGGQRPDSLRPDDHSLIHDVHTGIKR